MSAQKSFWPEQIFSAKRTKGPRCCGCRRLGSCFIALVMVNVPKTASEMRYCSIWLKLSGKNPIKILACTDSIMLPCKVRGSFCHSVELERGLAGAQERRKGEELLSRAVLWQRVACVLSQSSLVLLAVPADARPAGAASGPVHPCPASTGAWDGSQVKTQAASPGVGISSEGVQCHAEKGSCCPSCWASQLPQRWKVLALSRKHPALSGFRLLKCTSSKESKCEPFTA